MDEISDGKIIEMLLDDNRISQIELAKMTGISPTTLSGIKNQRYVKGEHVDKICKAFNMKRWEFYAYPYRGELDKFLPSWIPPKLSELLRIIDSEFDDQTQNHLWSLFQQIVAHEKKRNTRSSSDQANLQ